MLKFAGLGIFVLIVVFGINYYQDHFGTTNLFPSTTTQTVTGTQKPERLTTIAQNLEIPWEIVFLPNKDILFTERTGKLKLISDGQVTIVAQIPDVKIYGEGGLLGLAIHPDFNSNQYIYLYYTYSGGNDQTLNRVVRYKFIDNALSDRTVLIDNIPGAVYHNGGRLKFGPDNFLYITTGDSLKPSLSQDTNSVAGKILRVTTEGKAAPGNPFNNLVYSYGHRNPQGLAWDDSGRLWETEHGNNATDEVNIIVKGNNYGWPTITGNQTRNGMESPLAQSGADTWAPAGASFINGSLFYGGLKGKALFELKVENGTAIITKHLDSQFGRIRAVTLSPDNLLYISTSNRDGRGTPDPEDDKILQIDPEQL